MNHLSEGLLRRALDEPAALADDDRRHVGECDRCRAALAGTAADRDAVAALLGHGDEPDVDAAWRRLTAQLSAADAPVAAAPPAWAHPRRRSLRRPAVAVAAAAALVVGGTAAAAAVDWLPIFQPQETAAVQVDLTALDPAQVSAMPDLAEYGELTVPVGGQEPRDVGSAAEAEQVTGIAPPQVGELPPGVTGSPQYAVLDRTVARFTFSAAKAKAAAAKAGRSLPAMPAGVDGATLEIEIGPGVAEVWGAGGPPKLAVVRMGAPTARAEGVTLATLRDYLLAQPGIPAEIADQLRGVPDDGSVLPVPVPKQYADSRQTTVDGVSATEIALKDGSGAGLIWIEDGQLTAVGGLIAADEAAEVAGGLR